MSNRFEGKRVLVTQLDRYMGMPLAKAFKDEGAEVITDDGRLDTMEAVDALVERAGEIDILAANFAEDPLPQPFGEVSDQNVAEPEETAELALYLASDKCTHMVGQVIPWAGGWVTTTG